LKHDKIWGHFAKFALTSPRSTASPRDLRPRLRGRED